MAVLTHERLLEAIAEGAYGKWAGSTSQIVVVPWAVIANRADAERVVRKLSTKLPNSAHRTSIIRALEFGIDLFAEVPFTV